MNIKKTAIITDSTCDLPDELLKENNIYLVPLRIVYATHEYRDKLEISPQKVYDMLEQEIPKSSLPVPEDIIKILDEIKAEGYTDVLYVSLSSGLSGSYNLVRMIAQEYNGLNIEVVDSLILSMGLGFIVLEAAATLRATSDIAAAIMKIKQVRRSMDGSFVLNTLKYLKAGGRIGKVAATVGSILNLKPIITVNDEGVYETLAKTRGRQKSIDVMLKKAQDKYADKLVNVAVVHGAAKLEAEKLLVKAKQSLNIGRELITQVSPVLGLHTGPGLLGLIIYEV